MLPVFLLQLQPCVVVVSFSSSNCLASKGDRGFVLKRTLVLYQTICVEFQTGDLCRIRVAQAIL